MFILTASYLTLKYEDIQQSIKNLIHRRKALIYFAEQIVIDVLENTNFNFTSLIEEILMQKQPSEIFQKIKNVARWICCHYSEKVFDLTV